MTVAWFLSVPFSKILAPGLRLGWVHSSPGIIQRFVDSGVAASGGGLSHFAAAMAQATLDLGLLQENLANLRRIYTMRRDAVARILSTDLAGLLDFSRPDGGYFFWLTLADGVDADELLPIARKAGVSYRPGTAFSSVGMFRDSLRISFLALRRGRPGRSSVPIGPGHPLRLIPIRALGKRAARQRHQGSPGCSFPCRL